MLTVFIAWQGGSVNRVRGAETGREDAKKDRFANPKVLTL